MKANEISNRSQASAEYLVLLGALLVIVGTIVYSIYLASTALGSNVENDIENTAEQVENLLKMIFSGL